jgi:hypothetical protein
MDPLRGMAESTGYFTRPQVLHLGYDDNAINRACRTGTWHRIRPGAYTYADLWPASVESQQRLTGHVVADRLAPSVALSHANAALEHGLPVWGIDLSLTHVTRLDGGAGRTEAGVVHHEGLTLADDVVEMGGRLVMKPVRAALETASLGTAEAAMSLFDSLLHQGKGTSEGLEQTYLALAQWPDMQKLHVPLLMADPRPESVGESRSRWLFYTQHLPAPELQFPVYDDHGGLLGITDFAWPEHELLGEFDGKVKYLRYLRAGETSGDVVFREKRREQLVCEQLGWRMVRLVWADLYSPAATAARIRRLMRLAA